MSISSFAKSELRIQQLTDDKNRNLRVLASLLNEGKEGSAEYKALEQAVKDAESDISALRYILANPSMRAMREQQEQEARDNERKQTVTAVSENVTAAIITTPKTDERRQRIEAQMVRYLRTGDLSELRDVSVSQDNGALLSQDFAMVSDATRFYSTIVDDVYRYNADGGRPVKFPVSDDTAHGLTVVGETANTSSVEADPTVFSTVFSTANAAVDDLLTRLDYSKQFSDDVFSQSWIYRQLGVRAARGLAKAIMLGVDQNGTQLVASPTGGYLAGIAVGTTTATLSGGIGIDDLEALFSSVDESYASVGSFYLHQNTRSYLLSQKDSAGRSLYGASPQDGLKELFGRPVKIDNNLPAPTVSGSTFTWTASSTPVIFGNHALAYGAAISDTRIRVLKETHADIMVNEAICYVRLQAQKLIGSASASLKLAAS